MGEADGSRTVDGKDCRDARPRGEPPDQPGEEDRQSNLEKS